MIQKKICMLGYFAVGKTSLVRRYVHSLFSEEYITSIGVKIDKKNLSVNGKDLTLVVWDVYGEDSHQSVVPSYLRGMAGYLLVVDLTRPSTVASAVTLNNRVQEIVGDVPFVLVKNKSDLNERWEADVAELQVLESRANFVVETSAKTDTNVDVMFNELAIAVLDKSKQIS